MCTVLHVNYPSFSSDFNKIWAFPDRFFEKFSNNKFHENPSGGSRNVPSGRTGQTSGHDESNSRFSQFCKRAQKAHNCQKGLLRARWNFFESILPSPALTAANFSTHFHSRNLKNRCSNKAEKLNLLFCLRVCTFATIILSFAHGQVWSLQRNFPSEINICSTRNQQWRKPTCENFQLGKYIFCRTDHEQSVFWRYIYLRE